MPPPMMPPAELPFGVGPGPAFIGTIINVMLYGLLVAQMVDYYLTSKRDYRWLTIYVTLLFLVGTFESAITVYSCYSDNILWGRSFRKEYPWAPIAELYAMAFIVTSVQLFFAYRVNRLSGSRWVVTLLVGLSLVQFISGLAAATSIIVFGFADMSHTRPSAIAWFTSSVVSDVAISTALVWRLYQTRTGITSTDALISRIILLTIQTNLVTTVSTTACLILYFSLPHQFIYIIFTLPYCPLYLNALMSTLNARQRWDSRFQKTTGALGPAEDLSTIEFEPGPVLTEVTSTARVRTTHRHYTSQRAGAASRTTAETRQTRTTATAVNSLPSHQSRPQDDDLGSIEFTQVRTESSGDDELQTEEHYNSVIR